MANIKYMTNIDLRGNALVQANLEQLASAPAGATAGRVYFDTTMGAARVYTGTAWVRLDSAEALAAVSTLATDVAADISDAVAGEATLRQAADTELAGDIAGVASDLSDETTARIAGDTQVAQDAANALTAATGTLNTAIGAVASDLAAEVTARETAVAQALLDAAADATTKANTAQQNAEDYADTAVSNAINNLVDNAPAALDTLAELAAAANAADTALDGLLTDVAGTVNAAGTGLTKTGRELSIDPAWNGQSSIDTVGTITSGTWNGSTIAVANGGTGATDAAGARANLNVPTREAFGGFMVTGQFTLDIDHMMGVTIPHVAVYENGQQVLVGVEVLDGNNVRLTGNAGPGQTFLDVVITG